MRRQDDTYLDDQYAFSTFMRRVLSVSEAPMRRRQVQRHIRAVDVETAATHLYTALVGGVRGDPDARMATFAIVDLLNHADATDQLALEAIHLHARGADLEALAWLLVNPPPARSVDQIRMNQGRGRAMTLGERRTVASGWDPKLLDRLTGETEPMVIERLCANPRVREAHLLPIVTRRPTRPEILDVVARHPRWFASETVREAIVQNPYVATGLALRMMPLVSYRTLVAVRNAGDLHPALRRFAGLLDGLRRDGAAPGHEADEA